MDASLIPILLMLVVATLMAAGMLISSYTLGRVRQSQTDLSPYECGMDPFTDAHQKISIRYYLVALLFLLFDIETVLLYPVAVAFRGMVAEEKVFIGTSDMIQGPGWSFVLAEFLIFVTILIFGLIYVWRKGALEWE